MTRTTGKGLTPIHIAYAPAASFEQNAFQNAVRTVVWRRTIFHPHCAFARAGPSGDVPGLWTAAHRGCRMAYCGGHAVSGRRLSAISTNHEQPAGMMLSSKTYSG